MSASKKGKLPGKQQSAKLVRPKKSGADWVTKMLTTTVPGAVIIIGVMLIAIGDKSGDYVVGAGIILQLVGLGWKVWSVHKKTKGDGSAPK